MDRIVALDQYLFFLFNNTLANTFFDVVMPIITKFKYSSPLILFAAIWLLWKGGRKGRVTVLALAIAIGLSDFTNHHLFKEMFERFRPCDPRSGLEGVRALLGQKTSFSFPSNHAANITAAAVVVSFYYRHWVSPMILIAAVICFSRIYVGVHYPADVLAGAIVGMNFAIVTLLAMGQIAPVELSPTEEKTETG